jgi:uncharacterized membrane protein
MKIFLTLALATFSLAAKAETVNCVFTEPFFSVQVNEAAGTVLVNTPEGDYTYPLLEITRINGDTRVIYGNDIEENSVLVFRKDWQGTDGMSDFVYPYSAEFWEGDSQIHYGGCSTETEKPREMDYGYGTK